MNNEKRKNIFKISIVGSGEVGKTTIYKSLIGIEQNFVLEEINPRVVYFKIIFKDMNYTFAVIDTVFRIDLRNEDDNYIYTKDYFYLVTNIVLLVFFLKEGIFLLNFR